MVVDQRPVLKKAVTTCRRLRTELQKKQEQLRVFEECDLAAFNRWVNASFGQELTRIRELREACGTYEFIFRNLRFCAIIAPDDLREVCEELFRRKREGTLHAFEFPFARDTEAGPEEDDDADEWDEDEDEDEEVFGQTSGRGEATESGFSEGGPASGFGKKAGQARSVLKSLYRTLAKRLHPDRAELPDALRERRWHELQEAYERGDFEAIRRIEAVCDMDESGISKDLGLARLRELAEYHRSHLGPIREALKEAKRNPAFGFAKNRSETVCRQVRAEIKESVEELEGELASMEEAAVVARRNILGEVPLGRERSRRPSPKPSRQPVEQMEFSW